MKKRLIPIVLFLSLVGLGGLSLVSIHNLQGNARVINYTGVVRGATQRLVKEELKGRADDALIARLDGIMEELATGVGANRLIRLNDQAYQDLLASMEDQWQELKEEIMLVRQGKDSQTLFELSESFFQLADTTVTAAEQYTEQQVNRTSRGFGILILGAMGVWGILVWQERRQDKMQAVIRERENANRQQKQRLDRMWDTLRAPLNDISEMMYVSDVETHELLFLNEAGMRNFHLDSIEGKRCYEVLHGRSEPCPFCGEHFTDYDNIVTWENTNPITGRHYLLKDRLIEWNDRPARLEIAFDVTEAEKEKQSLKFALRAEDMLVDCVRSLYEDRGIGEILPVILDKLGRFMNADRSYVFMLRDGKLYNEYEWCAGGVESQMDTLQGLPLEFIDRWLKIFDRQECMVLEDVQDLKEDYRNEYEILTAQGITSLVAAPLERDGHFCGAIGVDNPPLEQLVNIGPLLRTLGYFLMLSYRRDENEKELNRLSYHDTLTSFYNRNRYIADTDNLRETQSPVGIVYLDVNGLKDINDLRGHAFGDKVLVECARRMRETFEGADFYRIGGDEFVIICREWSKEVFEEKGVKVPTNYDELLDVCGKINDPANNFYAIACRGEKIALTSQFSPFLYGFGGAYFKDGTCAFNTPENLEAARFYGKLLGDYAPEGILTAGYSQMTQLFNAGQVGMCVDAIALYQTLIDPNESSFYDKVGVAPIPEGPAGRQSYKQVVWGASIYSGSKNKEAAWEFLKYAAGKDIAADITPKGMPTFRASVWEDERVTAAMPEDYIQAYNEEIQADTTNQYGLPRMTAVSEARDAMGEAIVYSIETKGEGADLESKMNAAAEKVDQLLKDAGEYGADYPYED